MELEKLSGPLMENATGKKGKATFFLAQGSVAVRYSTFSSRPRQGGVGRSTSIDPRRGRSRSIGYRFLGGGAVLLVDFVFVVKCSKI